MFVTSDFDSLEPTPALMRLLLARSLKSRFAWWCSSSFGVGGSNGYRTSLFIYWYHFDSVSRISAIDDSRWHCAERILDWGTAWWWFRDGHPQGVISLVDDAFARAFVHTVVSLSQVCHGVPLDAQHFGDITIVDGQSHSTLLYIVNLSEIRN